MLIDICARRAVDYDVSSDLLYSGSYDQTIKVLFLCSCYGHIPSLTASSPQVWDVKTQACRRTLRGHSGWISAVALLQNAGDSGVGSPMLASASWDSTIRLWRVGGGADEMGDAADALDQGYRVMTAGQGNALYCVGVGDGGRIINVGCRHRQIQRWDIERGACVSTLLGHGKEVQAIDTSNDIIVSGSGDGTAKLWDALTDSCSVTLCGHTDSVMAVQV